MSVAEPDAGVPIPPAPGRLRLLGAVALRVGLFFPLLGAVLFGTAGSFGYWNAWLFLGLMAALMLGAMSWMIVRDPELLAKRLRTRERRTTQQRFVAIGTLLLLAGFILPGLDWRFGWSHLPDWLVFAATGIVLLGLGLFFLVIRFNRFASRVIEVQAGQRVIDTGPYRIVRHPMYAAVVLIYLALPLMLGSLPALAVFAAFVALLPVRIINEEKLLRDELPGYADYQARVRWRLIPGIW